MNHIRDQFTVGDTVAYRDTTLGHEILDVANAQIETMIQPEREACPWGTTY